MSRQNLSAYPLTADKIDQAYPLARENDRAMSLADWRRHAGRRLSAVTSRVGAHGILVLERNGCLRAMVECDAQETRAKGRVLNVSRIVVSDRIRDPQLALTLLGSILEAAEATDCLRIRIVLGDGHGWLHRYWSDPEGAVYRRPVVCVLQSGSDDTGARNTSSEIVPFPPRYPAIPKNSNN